MCDKFVIPYSTIRAITGSWGEDVVVEIVFINGKYDHYRLANKDDTETGSRLPSLVQLQIAAEVHEYVLARKFPEKI